MARLADSPGQRPPSRLTGEAGHAAELRIPAGVFRPMTVAPRYPHSAAPTRRPTPDERATSRDLRRAFLLASGACILFTALGLALMGVGLHTGDADRGQVAFLGGLIVGYAGIAVTLGRFYLRGEREGWW